jgi:glycosyltransferase involved in cell wall biosynthesis
VTVHVLHYAPRALGTNFGTPSAIRDWCDALAREGAETTLVVDPAVQVVARPRHASIRPLEHRLSTVAAGRFRFAPGLEREISRGDLLVLHGGWSARNAWAARLAARIGVPYIVTPHGRYDPHVAHRTGLVRRAWWTASERPMLEASAAVHLFFEDEETVVPPHVQTVVAPNGMEAPDGVRWRGGPGSTILWLGRFDVEHKGLDLLMEALCLIEPPVRPTMDLYGHDWRSGRQQIARLVERRGLSDRVRLHPPIVGPEKWATIAGARGFVYPSRWEAFGLAPAEAVAIGAPCVLTPFPLARFLAGFGVAALAEPEPEPLAKAIVEMWTSQLTGPTRGPTVIRDHLSWKSAASRWLEQVTTITGLRTVPVVERET